MRGAEGDGGPSARCGVGIISSPWLECCCCSASAIPRLAKHRLFFFASCLLSACMRARTHLLS